MGAGSERCSADVFACGRADRVQRDGVGLREECCGSGFECWDGEEGGAGVYARCHPACRDF